MLPSWEEEEERGRLGFNKPWYPSGQPHNLEKDGAKPRTSSQVGQPGPQGQHLPKLEDKASFLRVQVVPQKQAALSSGPAGVGPHTWETRSQPHCHWDLRKSSAPRFHGQTLVARLYPHQSLIAFSCSHWPKGRPHWPDLRDLHLRDPRAQTQASYRSFSAHLPSLHPTFQPAQNWSQHTVGALGIGLRSQALHAL